MTWSTRRSNGAIPVLRSQRPKNFARCTSMAAMYAQAPQRLYSCSTFMGEPGRAGSVRWRRCRAWMLVFSSAEMTKSSLFKGFPCHWRSYRSRMRPALIANCGSRGNIHVRCCQGRMASSLSHRHTVLSLIVATKPTLRTYRAMSAVLHRDKGTPVVAGSSHASAFTSITTSGGEDPGAPRAVSIIEPRHSLVEESLSPETDHFASGIQPLGDFIVAQSFVCQEDDLCPLNQKIR